MEEVRFLRTQVEILIQEAHERAPNLDEAELRALVAATLEAEERKYQEARRRYWMYGAIAIAVCGVGVLVADPLGLVLRLTGSVGIFVTGASFILTGDVLGYGAKRDGESK